MPGDLRDPEQFQTFHYDPKYDATPNMMDPGSFDMDNYLQSISMDTLGRRVDNQVLDSVKDGLADKGFFHQNIGDEAFRNKVKELLLIRRVISRYARSRSE